MSDPRIISDSHRHRMFHPSGVSLCYQEDGHQLLVGHGTLGFPGFVSVFDSEFLFIQQLNIHSIDHLECIFTVFASRKRLELEAVPDIQVCLATTHTFVYHV